VSAPRLQPIAAGERLASLDIIRGLALFGVLQVNLTYFSGHSYQDWAGLAYPLGWGGEMLTWLRDHLLKAKAILCFSLLFGVGLCIQMDRARAKGLAFGLFAARRLGALALFGVAHALLLWNGDIPLVYALAGLFLLPFLDARPRALVLAAAVAFAASVLREPVFGWLHVPEEFRVDHWLRQAAWLLEAANQGYGRGSWLEAARWRSWEWQHLDRCFNVKEMARCLPLFLLGLALWRKGVFRAPDRHLGLLRRLFHGTFWVGLGLSLLPGSPQALMAAWRAPGGHALLLQGAHEAGALCLALGYVSGCLLLLRRRPVAQALGHLAPLGRTALTNYLAQSLAATWSFNAHGLGLWGRVSPSACVFGGILFYFFQILWSRWWLARFQYGPAEWLWRSMTYAALQPFQRRPQQRRG